ncbi:MAG: helix-turn-helix transcriptional regulator [Candidatus Thorarchaeota archaeon]
MSITTKSTLFVIGLLALCMLSSFTPARAQIGSQNMLMTNMSIHTELGLESDTTILLKTEFTNTDSVEISSFDIRIDVRVLSINEATINGTPVTTATRVVDNYVLVTFVPDSAIQAGTSGNLFLNFTAYSLQEVIGLDAERAMYDNHLIYYIRSLNEIQNLTFSAALPQHAIVDLDASAPLFPRPMMNLTDGSKSIYLWHADVLLPGQEIVYIIKYQMPAALVDTPSATATFDPLSIVIITALLTGLLVLMIERLPGWIRGLNSRELIVSGKISSQEQEILDLLNTHGGSCPQREIYENLDMSQSMTSMMLTSLEGRGLIRRLRSGRENIVHIMEED